MSKKVEENETKGTIPTPTSDAVVKILNETKDEQHQTKASTAKETTQADQRKDQVKTALLAGESVPL